MTLRIFETDQARYYLGLGRHDISSAPLFEQVDFSALDFMVFESGNIIKSKDFHYGVEAALQYSAIYHRIMKESNTISMYGIDYLPDHPSLYSAGEEIPFFLLMLRGARKVTQHKRTRRDLLTGAGMFATGFLFSPMPYITNLYENEAAFRIRTNLLPLPILGFRDALAAKKITEYIVPKHKKEGRKIQAAILYGAHHAGIEVKLKNPSFYQAPLELYHNLFEYAPSEDLNRILEVRKEEEKISTNTHSCKLF